MRGWGGAGASERASTTPRPHRRQPAPPFICRLYLIAKLPKLKLLDFARVRDAERKAAGVHFGGEAGAARLAEQAAQSAARTQPGGGGAGAGPLGGGGRAAGGGGAPSTAQLLALKAAIAGAATLDEVQRLEKALAAGQLPGGGDGMES